MKLKIHHPWILLALLALIVGATTSAALLADRGEGIPPPPTDRGEVIPVTIVSIPTASNTREPLTEEENRTPLPLLGSPG